MHHGLPEPAGQEVTASNEKITQPKIKRKEKNMIWSEALLSFRARNNFQGTALLAQNQNLMRLAAAWPMVKRTLSDYLQTGKEADLEQVWKTTKIDFPGWAELTQLHPVAVMEGFKVLKGNQIILPDGTLNHLAETLLQKQAAGKFMAEMNIKPGDLRR
jgi:hypothetical protein